MTLDKEATCRGLGSAPRGGDMYSATVHLHLLDGTAAEASIVPLDRAMEAARHIVLRVHPLGGATADVLAVPLMVA